MRGFEPSGFGFIRAGKGAALETKKLGLEQVGRQCRTIDLHHGLRRAFRSEVNKERQRVFSRSRFAGHKNVRIGGSNPLGETHCLAHRLRLRHYLDHDSLLKELTLSLTRSAGNSTRLPSRHNRSRS